MLPSAKQYRESMKTFEMRSVPRIGLPIQMFRAIRGISILGRVLRERVELMGQGIAMRIESAWQLSFCSQIEHRHWVEQCSVPLAS